MSQAIDPGINVPVTPLHLIIPFPALSTAVLSEAERTLL
jgi:hypothetical protein